VPSLAAGQAAGFARLDGVRSLDVKGGACYASISTTGDPQSVTRIRAARSDRPWPRDSVLFINDKLVIGRRTDVRLRVDGAMGRGVVYLTPEIGRCPGSDIGRHIVGRTPPAGPGSYELKKDTIGRGTAARERFVLSVKNGAAIVRWSSGQLLVRALDEQIVDLGSVFTVVVDSVANRGIVTVQEGIVTLRGGSVRAGAGEALSFGPGQPVRPVIVRSAGLDEIRFQSDEAWKDERSVAARASALVPPVPSLPWKKLFIGGILLGGGGYAAWKTWGEKGPPPPPPVRAIVVVTLPL
jgi:hypothetical protein